MGKRALLEKLGDFRLRTTKTQLFSDPGKKREPFLELGPFLERQPPKEKGKKGTTGQLRKRYAPKPVHSYRPVEMGQASEGLLEPTFGAYAWLELGPQQKTLYICLPGEWKTKGTPKKRKTTNKGN